MEPVLHTKASAYKLKYPSIEKRNNKILQRKIEILKERELEACQRLMPKCTSVEDFFSQLKEMFANVEDDRIVLNKFSPEIIISLIEKNWKKDENRINIDLADLKIVVNLIPDENSKELGKEIYKQLKKIQGIKISDILIKGVKQNKVLLTVPSLQEKNLTKALKTIQKMEKDASLNGRQSKWDVEKKNKQYLRKIYQANLKEKIEESPSKFIETKSAQDIQKHYQTVLEFGEDAPFTQTMDKDVRQRLNEDAFFEQQIKQKTREIEAFIFNNLLSGASPELIRAAKITWEDNITKTAYGIALFMKGGSENSIYSAFGEFRASIITNYINLKFGKDPTFSSMISDTLKEGEQAKMDVSILKNSGLQVKNYSEADTYNFEINSTLDKLSKYLHNENERQSLEEFLGNLCFNLSYRESYSKDLPTLANDLKESLFGEIASFNFDSSIEDTVLFYYIGSNMLIPVHEIYASMYNSKSKLARIGKLNINFSFYGYNDDEGFLEELNEYDFNIDGEPEPTNPLYWWWPIKGKKSAGPDDWYALDDTNHCNIFNKDIRFNGKIQITPNMTKYYILW